MKIAYATKRDRNGNRYILIIDSEKREYATTSTRWYSSEDFIEISKADRRRLLDVVESAGYTEIDHLLAEIKA